MTPMWIRKLLCAVFGHIDAPFYVEPHLAHYRCCGRCDPLTTLRIKGRPVHGPPEPTPGPS